MQFLITFLEGVISFISPCMLPMLPVYISYFAAGNDSRSKTLARSAAFVLGFTVVFSALGLFAGTVGALLVRYRIALNAVSGLIVILLGLSYLDVIRLPFFKGMQTQRKVSGLVSAFVFGVIYSVSLTPCIGAFLGSALMLASASGTALRGALLLVTYALGLGIPFLISAVLLEKLRTTFGWIKAHYSVINRVCGVFLIVIGILMATGVLSTVLKFFI
ncbi:MAG: cytochrome c biogenesis protein CcdA [Clostridia bacterium]|nr:cytochrome c biogenesis protein CcdA [Clostridia bacterium]